MVSGVGYDMVELLRHPNGMIRYEIIHIASEPADVNKRYQPDVELVGDISNSLRER